MLSIQLSKTCQTNSCRNCTSVRAEKKFVCSVLFALAILSHLTDSVRREGPTYRYQYPATHLKLRPLVFIANNVCIRGRQSWKLKKHFSSKLFFQRFLLYAEKHLAQEEDSAKEAERLKEHRELPPLDDDLRAELLRYRAPPVRRDEPLL